jgi:Nucleotide-diphospho-sugar transferase
MQRHKSLNGARHEPLGRRCSLSSVWSHGVVAWLAFYGGFYFGSRLCDSATLDQHTDSARVGAQSTIDVPAADPYSYWTTPTISTLFKGAALVDRVDLLRVLDTGVPVDPSIPGNQEALLLYSDETAMPIYDTKKRKTKSIQSAASDSTAQLFSFSNASSAIQNCLRVKVVLTPPKQKGECLALVGQWESFHLHNFMRIPVIPHGVNPRKDQFKASLENDLRYVARNQLKDGRVQNTPSINQTMQYYDLLQAYLHELPTTLDRLRPLAMQASLYKNTVVVLVCNWGQAELLFNFVCHAQSRGISLDSILVFCTDADTLELAQSLQLHAFDVQAAFGDMPTGAARMYGDNAFRGMMMAKVYCVHLVILLGYNVLFQDVDVVWYKNPLEYFVGNVSDTDNVASDIESDRRAVASKRVSEAKLGSGEEEEEEDNEEQEDNGDEIGENGENDQEGARRRLKSIISNKRDASNHHNQHEHRDLNNHHDHRDQQHQHNQPQRRDLREQHNKTKNTPLSLPYDIYFQDDGAHSVRYAPYSPNTGFYFVAYNSRTLYFFSTFCRSGDLIQMSGSHQSSLNTILSDQASSRGLRVKVFGRDDPVTDLFPGGFHYHNRRPFMRDMIAGKRHPYIFHMSWTKNKENKQKFFQQMGDWHVANQCRNVPVSEIEKRGKSVLSDCCLKEADYKCHYRDKPSKTSCKNSPPIDKGRPSFW